MLMGPISLQFMVMFGCNIDGQQQYSVANVGEYSYFYAPGSKTGRCVASDRKPKTNVCEIYSWCPVEVDELPMPGFNIRCLLPRLQCVDLQYHTCDALLF